MLPVPLFGELAEAGAAAADRVTRMEPHPAREVSVASSQQRPRGVLRAGEEGSDRGTGSGVVLSPVAVTAAPHLVDPPLGDPHAELRFVVHDGHLREVLRPPARTAKAAREIGLLGIDEE